MTRYQMAPRPRFSMTPKGFTPNEAHPCGCGCGLTFRLTEQNPLQRYINVDHQRAEWRRRAAARRKAR